MKKHRYLMILMVFMLMLTACTPGSLQSMISIETETVTTKTEPVATEIVTVTTEPTTDPIPVATAPTGTASTEPVTTVPIETEPEPIELTFSAYQQGTTGLRSVTSDQGVTLTVDKNHYFEFPEGYTGIKFWKTEWAMKNHVHEVTFECINGCIDTIEILGPDKKTRISPVDGNLVDPIRGNTVPGEYRDKIGYWYLRINGTSDNGEQFQLLLIKGTK